MLKSKTIRETSRTLGTILVVSFIVVVGLVAAAVQMIRVGGSMDRQNQITAEFVADIMPPALFLVEPMLHATWIVADPEQTDEHAAELGRLEKTYRERLQYWSQSELNPDFRQRVESKLVPLGDAFWTRVHGELIPAGQSRDPARIDAAHDRLEKFYHDYKAQIDELVAESLKENDRLHSDSAAVSGWTVVGLAVVCAVLVGLLLWTLRTLNRRALEPLAETAGTMKRMAAGDLDAGQTDQHRADEIGEMTRAIEVFRAVSRQQVASAAEQEQVVTRLSEGLGQLAEGRLDVSIDQRFAAEYEPLRASFNGTVATLGSLIREVADTARTVSLGASEILSASDDLAQRNERQAGSVEETAAAMRHAVSSVSASAQRTASMRDTIGETHGQIETGNGGVTRMVSAMEEIEQSSRAINAIITTIEGIAFQTNLLALNAGVEAARAGEAGKGFAVVANEVRALAQRSSDAAQEIGQLIKTSSLRVGEGVALVNATGEMLSAVAQRIGDINDNAVEISEAAEIQARDLEQVSTAMSDMDRVTQQNAAMVEQTTAAARSLAREAERLAQLVGRFDGAGGRAAQLPRQAAPQAPRMVATQPVQTAPVRRPLTVGATALAMSPETDWAEF